MKSNSLHPNQIFSCPELVSINWYLYRRLTRMMISNHNREDNLPGGNSYWCYERRREAN